jgi:hypothetical protein
MKYALLIYEARGSLEALPTEQYEAMFAEYKTAPTNRSSSTAARLRPVETATVVRVRDRQTLTTDGPFAGTKEVFGGFCVFDTDLDEAIELAADPGGADRRRDRGPAVGGALALLEEVFRDEWGRAKNRSARMLGLRHPDR